MNKILPPEQLREFSVEERLALMEDVWDTLANSPDTLPVPAWHRDILDQRLEFHESDPSAAKPWDEVKAELVGALRK